MAGYDEDELMDYEEELPEFETEAELDEYLNDEEYDLMNEVFANVKKEMVDYQGWDNFALKKTIFDTNFDLAESLKILRRSFKKKKPESMYKMKGIIITITVKICISFSTNYPGSRKLTLRMRMD